MTTDRFVVRMAAFCSIAAWSGLASADSTAILLKLSVESGVLDARELRETIQRELDRPVVLSPREEHVGELSIKSLPGSRVSVTYRSTSDQEPLVRIVSLPRDQAERTQWIVWLVGNLARDEAADWLSMQHRGGVDQSPVDAESTRENAAEPAVPQQATPAPAAPHVHVPTPALAATGSHVGGGPVTLERGTLNLSLWYKWLQLYPGSASRRFSLHLGAGYGRVGAIRGVGLDMLHHRVEHQVQGVAGSFIWASVPRTHGLAWSTGVVTATGLLRGADLAWVFAYRNASAGLIEPEKGVHAGSRPLSTNPDAVGVQLAGVGAWNRGAFVGLQGASAFARQQGQLRGAQMAGIASVADRVEGAQFAAVNVAGDVRGVQFGLVNYARRIDGIAIGLVNIAGNVRVQALPWVERDYRANLGVRYVYQPLTFGYSVSRDPALDRTRVLFGMGARLQRDRLAMVPTVNVGFFVDKSSGTATARNGHENDLRLSLEWEAIPRVLGLLAGPALAMQSDPEVRWRWVPRWFAGLSLF